MKGGYKLRKIAVFTLIFTLVFLLFTPTVFASNNADSVVIQVEKANEQIDKKIDKAIEQAEKFLDTKNEDMLIDKIIDKLINQTTMIADKMIDKAEKSDVEVYCELIEVEIGGQIIQVDPLIIGGA